MNFTTGPKNYLYGAIPGGILGGIAGKALLGATILPAFGAALAGYYLYGILKAPQSVK